MCYTCFTRTWWRDNPLYSNGLEPCAGSRYTIAKHVATEEEAQAICRQYNTTHNPGRLSRKAEYDYCKQTLHHTIANMVWTRLYFRNASYPYLKRTRSIVTISEVKRELPEVRIKWAGKHYWASVTGRLNQFATVSPRHLIDNKKIVTIIMGPCIHFSWSTVANCITNNEELNGDF